ncbi:MAG: aminopeptidase P N-terminal domain-containing protein [Cardiobacteriaceae bacterium]|nr:aminopeptidase P N-terminal domain-containing protein [Cardiobacteriaceae bacterium]
MDSRLPVSVFAARREALFARLPEGSAVVLFAPGEPYRNNDVHFPFRQDSYFWYFTGFPEPDAVALLHRVDGRVHYTLFSAPRDPLKEIWEGKIIGQDGAVADYGADAAYPLADLCQLPALLADTPRLYTILGAHHSIDNRIGELLRQVHHAAGRGGAPVEGLFDLRRIADDMRLVKSAEELALMRRAADISAAGHRAAMLAARDAQYEYEVQAAVEAEFRRHGCHWSFPSIIASGANACCLHYRDNNAPIRRDALLLVDAGAEYASYAGDITRTFPASGRFSREQQALYNIVLHAEEAAIRAARAGIRHLELHDKTARILIQGLLDEKVIHGSLDGWMENDRFKQFYPHGTGHWLGLDVHDVGVYKPDGESRVYQPGMVITIEPGLYIQNYDDSVDEKWRGIGIRVEDDVLITEGEAEVFSGDVPKSVRDIEALMQGKS